MKDFIFITVSEVFLHHGREIVAVSLGSVHSGRGYSPGTSHLDETRSQALASSGVDMPID